MPNSPTLKHHLSGPFFNTSAIQSVIRRSGVFTLSLPLDPFLDIIPSVPISLTIISCIYSFGGPYLDSFCWMHSDNDDFDLCGGRLPGRGLCPDQSTSTVMRSILSRQILSGLPCLCHVGYSVGEPASGPSSAIADASRLFPTWRVSYLADLSLGVRGLVRLSSSYGESPSTKHLKIVIQLLQRPLWP
jgi:hypothetical protein